MKKNAKNTKNKYYLVGYYNNITQAIYNNYNTGSTTEGYAFLNKFKYKLKVGDVVLLSGISDFNIGIILKEEEYSNANDLTNKTGFKNIDNLKNILGIVDIENLRTVYKNKQRKEELEKIINEKYEKISKIKILEQMCKDDNELTALLKEFKELDGD